MRGPLFNVHCMKCDCPLTCLKGQPTTCYMDLKLCYKLCVETNGLKHVFDGLGTLHMSMSMSYTLLNKKFSEEGVDPCEEMGLQPISELFTTDGG